MTIPPTPTRYVVTCDVECLLGHVASSPHIFRPWPLDACIWARAAGESWGIERLMDQLEARGARGTFYLSALQHRFYGDPPMAEIARAMHDRGHEVGVHTHCAWLGFEPGGGYRPDSPWAEADSVCDHPEGRQREALEESVERIAAWTGVPPVSFRAGNYGADATSLALLASLGIRTDSSRNAAWGSLDGLGTRNAAIQAHGLLEVPVTSFRALDLAGYRYRRFVDPSNMGVDEAARVFDAVASAGLRTLVLVTHSFQYVLPGHAGHETYRPRPDIVGRVDAILDLLARDPRFVPATMAELAEDPEAACGPDAEPGVPPWVTARRMVQSWRDRR